jgi:enoyl-CoA hydratase
VSSRDGDRSTEALRKLSCAVLDVEEHGPVAWVTLNRPEQLNALDDRLVSALGRIVAAVDASPTTHVAVITGGGTAFCAGGDLKFIDGIKDDPVATLGYLRTVQATLRAIELSPKPWVASVNGLAFAGGLELILACDVAFASTDAVLGDHHATYGLVPGGGATQRLPRQIGLRRAKELLLSGETVNASEAIQLGLVNRVCAPRELRNEVAAFATGLSQRSPTAMSRVKRLVREGPLSGLAEGLERETDVAARHFASRDFRIGLEAFQTRQPPRFGPLEGD